MARRREDGAAAVEFAIVAPLLFMLVFGIIQFGIFFAQDLALSNGARQAARAAAVPVTGDCQSIYDELLQGTRTIALDQTNLSFDMDVVVPSSGAVDQCAGPPFSAVKPCTGEDSGSTVTVTIHYEAQLALPFVGDFNNIPLRREGIYRCEFA